MILGVCKFCGHEAKVDTRYHMAYVFCPEKNEHKCPYPPIVRHKNLAEAKKQWQAQFAAKKEL